MVDRLRRIHGAAVCRPVMGRRWVAWGLRPHALLVRFFTKCMLRMLLLFALIWNVRADDSHEITGIRVKAIQLCAKVVDREPEEPFFNPGGRIRSKRIWFWAVLTGDQSTLDK